MLLAELLLLEDANPKNEMKRLFDEVSHKYFGEFAGKFPYPNLVIKSNLIASSKAGLFVGGRNEIQIDKDIANTPETLKMTLWHEAIHYYEWWTVFNGCKTRSDIQQWNFTAKFGSGGHGKYFTDAMNRINSGEGSVVITVKEASIEMMATKPFYAYVFKSHKKDSYHFCWSSKKEPGIIERIVKWAKQMYHDEFDFWHGESIASILKTGPRLSAGATKLSASTIAPSDSQFKFIQPLLNSKFQERIAA